MSEPRLSSDTERSGGKLRTQVGPAAWVPIWVASVGLTDGEYRAYTSLRSFADQDGESCFPSARKVAKRACLAYSTTRNALQKFNKMGLVLAEATYREDGSQSSNDFLLIDVCPAHLAPIVEANQAKWEADDAARRAATKTAKSAKGQVEQVEAEGSPPTLDKVAPPYPAQGRGPNPGKVGRATPRKVAITTPGITTPETIPDSPTDYPREVEVQPALDGSEPAPKPERDPTTNDRAYGIARGWMAYRAKQNAPVAGKRAEVILRGLIMPFLDAGYTDDEVKHALTELGEGIPSKAQLDRALTRRRTGVPSIPNARRGQPAPTDLRVNDHWDKVRAKELAASAAGGES